MASRVRPVWALLFGAAALGVSLFVAAERPFPHAAGQAPPEACAPDDDRAAAPDPCLEMALSDRTNHAAGETAWPTPC